MKSKKEILKQMGLIQAHVAVLEIEAESINDPKDKEAAEALLQTYKDQLQTLRWVIG